jgi:Lon protease-like protein
METQSLPLFPLNVVVFPEGLLPLKIFEMRYLDMVRNCLRNHSSFGVVAVVDDVPSTQWDTQLPFALGGTSVNIVEADAPQIGLMMIRCLGEMRFQVKSARQQQDGLWIGEVEEIENDVRLAIPDDLIATADNLHQLIHSLGKQGVPENDLPIMKPYKFDDCGWVANRWCELLNIPLRQKQRMLELDSSLVRLEFINDMFHSKQQHS